MIFTIPIFLLLTAYLLFYNSRRRTQTVPIDLLLNMYRTLKLSCVNKPAPLTG